mmetsp:Transcript_7959/g.8714  ORF Transcript_7959/g.8714 Transcript_7959/m.8714 type:complete len:293 (-) Transcript_7959:52-930(-)
MSRTVSVAATQFSIDWDIEKNINKAVEIVREAARKGAQIILLQELFKTVYFCQEQKGKYFDWAEEGDVTTSTFLQRFSSLAKELSVVLPISFFEKKNNAYYNSIMVFDADGNSLGIYRKTHIPDGPGYQEKFYFTPGDSGFKVFNTRYAKIGIGICWDQWFPETARCLALQGAELLFFPTAIGSEPVDPTYSSTAHWQTVMLGHAAANIVPVIASNRIGTEVFDQSEITFYGSSFICNETGELMYTSNRTDQDVLVASFNLEEIEKLRRNWGLFRDRRPNQYHAILTKDGNI